MADIELVGAWSGVSNADLKFALLKSANSLSSKPNGDALVLFALALARSAAESSFGVLFVVAVAVVVIVVVVMKLSNFASK